MNSQRSKRPKESSASAETILKSLHEKSEVLERMRKEQALAVFHDAAVNVPAYAAFLKENSIAHKNVRTFADFEKVPPVDKKNYLRKYPIKKLSQGGNLSGSLVYTSTSGSTGEPVYFHRQRQLDWQGSIAQELFIANGAHPKEPTLAIICFGMGVWIGGLITYEGVHMASERGYPVSIITPGINKAEIFKALKRLSPHYAQTIIYGYAPFIKDILDEAKEQGVNVAKLHLRLSTAAEAYTEEYRSFVARKTKMRNTALDTMNVYGSAELGTMAFETPLSIAIRRALRKSPKAWRTVFGDTGRTPTLAQYFPQFVTFECVDGELLLTGKNSIPLVRYAIGDRGGVWSYAELLTTLKKVGISLDAVLRESGLKKEHVYQIPFVYVYERNDLSTTLYGLKVYPEIIRNVLLRPPFSQHLTGKFTLLTKYDAAQNQHLEINLELQKQKKGSKAFALQLKNSLIKELQEKNSEYKELLRFLGTRAHPRLVFWPAEDPTHFKPGIKQQWVKK